MKKWPTVAGNIATWGGVKLTGRDITTDLQTIATYQGAHRFKYCSYYSGAQTVNPNSTVTLTVASGIGYAESIEYCASIGIPAENSRMRLVLDGMPATNFSAPYPEYLAALGITTVGVYSFGSKWIFVAAYDTTNNIYDIRIITNSPPAPFRNSLAAKLQNTHSSLTATMYYNFTYYLFVASKMVIAKLSSFKDAKEIRKKFKQEKLGCSAVVVERLGYFENEEEHPYKEFLKDLPNKFDVEVGALKTKSASENVQNFVITLYVKEDTSLGKINQLVKPEKILYEEDLD